MSEKCSYDYICVIDFEATCINNNNMKEFYPHEIIEFPCVLIDVKHLTIKSTYHAYVKPTLNPELSEFCKTLTGITQDSIDSAQPFSCVLDNFVDFIKKNVAKQETFVVLTDGSWDLSKFLVLQCILSDIKVPSWARKWIDLKKTYGMYHKNTFKIKLEAMLDSYGMKFEGRLHSGKDDAYNIAKLVIKMMEEGCQFITNDYFSASNCRRLEKLLTAYIKNKQKEMRKNAERKTHKNECSDSPCVQMEMDIDPDLIGCEHLILKNKS